MQWLLCAWWLVLRVAFLFFFFIYTGLKNLNTRSSEYVQRGCPVVERERESVCMCVSPTKRLFWKRHPSGLYTDEHIEGAGQWIIQTGYFYLDSLRISSFETMCCSFVPRIPLFRLSNSRLASAFEPVRLYFSPCPRVCDVCCPVISVL
jgi:hypothetical protein